MRVKKADAAAIVLTLLDEFQLPPGGRILYRTLRDAWPQVGLRYADLDTALVKLLASAILEFDPIGHLPRYKLTAAGYKEMVALNSPATLGLASYQRLRRVGRRRALVTDPLQAATVAPPRRKPRASRPTS